MPARERACLIIEGGAALIVAWILLRLCGLRWLKSLSRISGASDESRVRKWHSMTQIVSNYIPITCACLEVASAVRLLSIVHHTQAQVVIGVANSPFVAHAWIVAGDMQFGAPPSHYTIVGVF